MKKVEQFLEKALSLVPHELEMMTEVQVDLCVEQLKQFI
jgi:hypothetical protein